MSFAAVWRRFAATKRSHSAWSVRGSRVTADSISVSVLMAARWHRSTRRTSAHSLRRGFLLRVVLVPGFGGGNGPSSRHLLDPRNADDVQGAEHDRFVALRQRDHHVVFDDGRVLGVLDAEGIAAADPNLKRLKSILFT